MTKKRYFFLIILTILGNYCFAKENNEMISKIELCHFQAMICQALNDFDITTLNKYLSENFVLDDSFGPGYEKVKYKKSFNRNEVLGFIGLMRPAAPEIEKGVACTRQIVDGSKAKIFGFAQSHYRINSWWDGISSRRFKVEVEKENGKIQITRVESSGEDDHIQLYGDFLWNLLGKKLFIILHGIGFLAEAEH